MNMPICNKFIEVNICQILMRWLPRFSISILGGFSSCIYSGRKIKVLEILGHQNIYPFFNKKFKIFIQIFHTSVFKHSVFEASEALQKTILKKTKTRYFHKYSCNSEVEITLISLIWWTPQVA